MLCLRSASFGPQRAVAGNALIAAAVVLTGHVVDRTTSQVLGGVDVTIQGPALRHSARTSDTGQYRLGGLTPGRYTLTLSSDDIPPQTFDVVVRAAKVQHFDMTACSTTLDYSCAAAAP